MMEYTAVGDAAAVKRYLDDFSRHTGADELIVTLISRTLDKRLRAASILADLTHESAA
jgi:hypothetical protein